MEIDNLFRLDVPPQIHALKIFAFYSPVYRADLLLFGYQTYLKMLIHEALERAEQAK